MACGYVENRATEVANHRTVPTTKIIRLLTEGRKELVAQLELLTEAQVQRVALHPRLQQPMRLLDWIYFLAEHDDHHLALARSAISNVVRMTNEH